MGSRTDAGPPGRAYSQGMDTIRETFATFSADREAAKTAPKVTTTLNNGFARASAGPFNWDIDLPGPLGGGNQSPSPTAYFLGALAGCAVAFINDTLAPEFDVEIEDISATAGCTADLSGLVGVPGADPRLGGISLIVEITSTSASEQLSALRQAWTERCPIYLAITEPNDIELTFT